jgi:anti-sigma factor RsiW
MLTPVPPTDCMLARENASARLDGELTELDALRLDAHLASCGECASFAAGIARTAGELRAAALDPAPAAVFFARPRRWTRPHVAAVAAVWLLVAAAAGSSFLVGRQLGGGSAQPLVIRTATAATRTDPGLLAMLHGDRGLPSQNRRAVAL